MVVKKTKTVTTAASKPRKAPAKKKANAKKALPEVTELSEEELTKSLCNELYEFFEEEGTPLNVILSIGASFVGTAIMNVETEKAKAYLQACRDNLDMVEADLFKNREKFTEDQDSDDKPILLN